MTRVEDNPEKFRAEWNSQLYEFVHAKGKGNLEEFKGWFESYALKAPTCITCQKLIFPGEAVGENGQGLVHMYWDCCLTAGFFVGHLNKEGQVVSPEGFEPGESLAARALRTGRMQIYNV